MSKALESADAASKHLARPVLVAGAARLGPLLAAAYLTELQVLPWMALEDPLPRRSSVECCHLRDGITHGGTAPEQWPCFATGRARAAAAVAGGGAVRSAAVQESQPAPAWPLPPALPGGWWRHSLRMIVRCIF